MKFKINRDHFVNGLQQVLNVVSSRATMPILGNVLIETTEGGVQLTTTNLDIGIRTSIVAEIEDAGAITLPVRKLATIVKELPQLDVFFETTDKLAAKITSGGSTCALVEHAGFACVVDHLGERRSRTGKQIDGPTMTSRAP